MKEMGIGRETDVARGEDSQDEGKIRGIKQKRERKVRETGRERKEIKGKRVKEEQ